MEPSAISASILGVALVFAIVGAFFWWSPALQERWSVFRPFYRLGAWQNADASLEEKAKINACVVWLIAGGFLLLYVLQGFRGA